MRPAGEPNFDGIARVYRWAEYLALGPALQRTRLYFLPELSQCRHALVLGDGDGRFLAEMLRANAEVRALAVDTSARMLSLLRERCHWVSPTAAGRLLTQRQSALLLEPSPKTDLVVTHFLLDCLQQADVCRLACKLAAHCRPGTLWLVSDFAIPKSAWYAPAARLYVRALYLVFGLLTGLGVQRLPDITAALKEAGFRPVRRQERLGGLLFTELWHLGSPG